MGAENRLGTGEDDDFSFLNSLVHATNLNLLNMDSNNFGVVLPCTTSNFSTDLRHLRLENTKIVGNIPDGLGNVVHLEGIGLSVNHLTGNIPVDIWKLQRLWILNLISNDFYGEIPSAFGN